jgi:REP element-mobilizing transposase RayT
VHLLLSVPPHVSASRVMQSIKGNLNIRMGSRRFTRLTNAFSKRAENHAHAVALHFWHYNFARKHLTLKTTPAVAAGIASKPITMLDLVRMIENEERKLGGRLTDYLPACQP